MKVVSLPVKPRPRRSRLESALMRMPALYTSVAALVLRLPPGSPPRTLMLRMALARSYAALARRDLDFVAQVFFHADTALEFGDDVGPDYDRRYQGRALAFDAYRRWLEEWGEMRREPAGFVDRGDVVVVLGKEHVRGESSGLEIERELGQVLRLRGGAVAELTEYRTWDEALRAAQ